MQTKTTKKETSWEQIDSSNRHKKESQKLTLY